MRIYLNGWELFNVQNIPFSCPIGLQPIEQGLWDTLCKYLYSLRGVILVVEEGGARGFGTLAQLEASVDGPGK